MASMQSYLLLKIDDCGHEMFPHQALFAFGTGMLVRDSSLTQMTPVQLQFAPKQQSKSDYHYFRNSCS